MVCFFVVVVDRCYQIGAIYDSGKSNSSFASRLTNVVDLLKRVIYKESTKFVWLDAGELNIQIHKVFCCFVFVFVSLFVNISQNNLHATLAVHNKFAMINYRKWAAENKDGFLVSCCESGRFHIRLNFFMFFSCLEKG